MSTSFSLPSQLRDDHALQQVLNRRSHFSVNTISQLTLPVFVNNDVLRSFQESLESLSQDDLSKDVMDNLADAEKNPPFIKQDASGHHVDHLVTSNGWKKLREFDISRV
jgi:hypothetical protein